MYDIDILKVDVKFDIILLALQHKFKKFDTLDGNKNHKARFGLSVACAGNLNLDGTSRENRRGIEDLVKFQVSFQNVGLYISITFLGGWSSLRRA